MFFIRNQQAKTWRFRHLQEIQGGNHMKNEELRKVMLEQVCKNKTTTVKAIEKVDKTRIVRFRADPKKPSFVTTEGAIEMQRRLAEKKED